MNTNYQMPYYNPEDTKSFTQSHTVLYTFQYQDAFAQIVSVMGGNVMGGDVMITDFENGLTALVSHEINKKHAVYEYPEQDDEHQEVVDIIFYYPNGDRLVMGIEDVQDYLIGIQIIDYHS